MYAPMACQQAQHTRQQLPSPDLASDEMWPRQSDAAPTCLHKLAARGKAQAKGETTGARYQTTLKSMTYLHRKSLETQRRQLATAIAIIIRVT